MVGYFSVRDYQLRGDALGENFHWIGRGPGTLGLKAPSVKTSSAPCTAGKPGGEQGGLPKLTRDRESGGLFETHRAGIGIEAGGFQTASFSVVSISCQGTHTLLRSSRSMSPTLSSADTSS